MVLKRKLPSRVQQEAPAPATMPPAAPSTAAVSLPEDTAPVFAAEAPLTFAEAPAEEAPQPETPVATPVQEPLAPQEEVELQISTPTDNPMKRKMRDKRPREFATKLPEAPQGAQPSKPAFNPAIPQTDVDFEKVSERLSSMGVKEAEKDTLTATAAPQAAEMEAPAAFAPPPAPEPVPEVKAEAPKENSKPADKKPDWLAELTKELEAAMPKERDPKRDRLGLPPPPTLPPNLLAGLVVDEESPPEPTPPPAAAQPKMELPPTPVLPTPSMHGTSQSDVPWASNTPKKDEWNLDLPADKEAASLPPSPTQPADIYAGIGTTATGAPPWQSAGASPAELPGARTAPIVAMNQASYSKFAMTAVILLLVLGGGYWLVSRGDKTQEQLARLTGSLRETTERLPSGEGTLPTLQPEQTLTGNPNLLPPPDGTPNTNAVIDFADVPADQANKPIVADGSENLPEDVGFVASLQKAIAEKKAERMQGTDPEGNALPTTGNPALDKTIRNNALKAQLDAELSAYRKALVDAGNVAEAPRPGEFLGQNQAATPPAKPYMNAAENTPTDTEGAPLSPPPAGKDGLPPASLYANNPANLPILPEPTAEAAKVRTLEDFDVTMFEPEKDKIRIPKGIRPRMSTSDFPEMDVLSMVPNKGLIAYKDGTEGVLLIGETVDGWQLVQVNADTAEFKNGGRSYYVSAE